MKVSVVIPTRGDVDLQPVIDSLPPAWQIVIWDNGERMVTRSDGFAEVCTDLSVYGRYAAIEYATHDLCFTQDDDVIISDPQAIVDAWVARYTSRALGRGALPKMPPDGVYNSAIGDAIVANMPIEFRHEGYVDSCLVGFGSCFHRDLPERAFASYGNFLAGFPVHETGPIHYAMHAHEWSDAPNFLRTCDVVFTTLTPRVLVDVPKTDREMASDPNRMWKQPTHYGERDRMLKLARQVRDA